MHLERKLQIGVAALVALSTVLLGMGEQSTALAVAAVIIAAASVYVTDVQGWISLSTRAADGLAVVAAFLALVQWQRDEADAGLLALLNFVVYGQFILQFKRKRVGIYWLLLTLSFIEASVAAALNESLAFGIVMLIYVFLGIAVLTIFYLFREHVAARDEQFATTGSTADEMPPSAAGAKPRAAQAACFLGHVSEQQTDAAVNRSLGRLLGNLSGLTLGMACLTFVMIPRSERGAWRVTDADQTQRVVGFSSEVQLGELGSISESAEEVMEVRIEDPLSGDPIELIDEPLFRGVVLTTYDKRRWKRELPHGKPIEARSPPAGAPYLRQKFSVRPLDTSVLFTIYPAYSPSRRPEILWDERAEQLVRVERKAGNSVNYELLTTGITAGKMSPLVPALHAPNDYERRALTSLPNEIPGVDPLAGTKALASRIVRDVPAENRLERARILANYLRDPTNFRYTLAEVQRDPALDPVEDFLTVHRAGHCEYFASALTLMLRAAGIPARLAIGFKGGDWTGSVYQVRQLNAHAWVEAYLGPDDLPEKLPPGVDRERGAWYILDPTAPADAPEMSARSYLVEGWRQFLSSLRTGWRQYVLGMNHSRQQDTIYEPLLRSVVGVAVRMTDREFWATLGAELARRFSPAYWGLANGGWFSWRGALAAMVIMLALLGCYYAGRAIVRRWWRASRAAAIAERARADVEFYRRLENLLAQNNLVRGPSQTQREFALAIGGQFTESAQTKHAASWTRQLAELFYRVRFGGRPLDSHEAATVEQALLGMAAALSQDSARRGQDRR